MKKGRKTRTKTILALVLCFSLLLLALAPVLARAADTDNDLIPDSVESAALPPVTLADGTTYTLPTCVGSTLSRNACLDPNTPDIFAIIATRNPTLFPTDNDPLAFLEASSQMSGWGVHYLSQSTKLADQNGVINGRTIYSDSSMTQDALRLTEDDVSTLQSGNLLGITTWGIPSGYDDSVIYSERIKEWVTNQSSASGITEVCYVTTSMGKRANPVCCSTTDTTDYPQFLQNLWQNIYLKSVCAHEAGHSMELTATFDATVGYHYSASNQPTIMDQYVYTTTKKGVLTWYIGDRYATTDQPVLK